MQINRDHYFLYLFLAWMLAVAGCTGHLMPANDPPETVEHEDFVIVSPTPRDTWASLARKYLKNENRAWQIRAFNDTDTLIPGRQVVIPLAPVNLGGIHPHGYQTIPVLLYTRLATRPTNAHTVSVQQFENHIQYLDDNGFTTISLDLLNRFSDFKEPVPRNAIVISFDTTQRWVYDFAYPILKRRGMRGALFVRIKEVGKEGKLTWKHLAEMADGGFDIGAHGAEPGISAVKDLKNHLKALEEDMTGPKTAFKKQLKINCRHYAYPKGKDNDLIIALLKKHGYRSAFTRIRGSNPFFLNPYKLRRSVIYGHYSMVKFGQNLATFRKADLK